MSNPEMRDARLQQALQHMPDAHMQASRATRLAVLRAAQEAVGPRTHGPEKKDASTATKAPWWHSVLGAPGNRMPWNAAFATVLIASLVTLLWQEQEVPDAKPDSEKVAPTAAPAAPMAPAVPLVQEAKKEAAPAQPASPPPKPSAAGKDIAAKATAPKDAVQAKIPPTESITESLAKSVPMEKSAESPAAAVTAPTTLPRSVAPAPAPSPAAAMPAAAPPPLATPPAARAAAPDSAQAAKSAGADTASELRSRADTPLSGNVTVRLGDRQREVTQAEAGALLAALRALPVAVATASTSATASSATQMADAPTAAITVQIGANETWRISPNRAQRMRDASAPGGSAQSSRLTAQTESRSVSPAQYAELQRLTQLLLER